MGDRTSRPAVQALSHREAEAVWHPCDNGGMQFNTVQLAVIAKALGAKVKMPCPSCTQPNKRQLMPDVLLLSFRPQEDPAVERWRTYNEAASGSMRAAMAAQPPRMLPGTPTGPVQFSLPCVVTTCMNCGYTEMYNVHVLGIGRELGLPDPGVPLG